jgi:hypothetical protein
MKTAMSRFAVARTAPTYPPTGSQEPHRTVLDDRAAIPAVKMLLAGRLAAENGSPAREQFVDDGRERHAAGTIQTVSRLVDQEDGGTVNDGKGQP